MTSRNTESLVLVVRAKNLASRELRAVGQDLDKVSTKSGGLKSAAMTLGKVGGAALIGVGAAAAGMAVASVKAFGEFEDRLNQAFAIMGDVAPEVRDQMSDTARAIGKETRIGAGEAADAFYYLASAGYDAAQSIEAVPQLAAFAQAGMMDMAAATDMAADAQSALGLKVKDPTQNLQNLARVTDVLTKGNIIANASIEDMSLALTNKAGAALRLVNKDVEEGVAVLAAFADQGIKAEEGGTALGIVMRDLQRASIANKDAWEANGVSVFDTSGKMLNMADIIGQLEGLLAGMSDEQKKVTLAQLGFNDKSVQFLQTLLGTSEKIREYESDLRAAGGTTQEVADKQMETINAQFEVLGHRAQDVMIGLGKDLAPVVKNELVPALEGLIDSTGMFVEKIGPPLIKAISLVVDSMTGLQVIALDVMGIFDDDARRKKELIVLNRELAKGLGDNLAPTERLATAMLTLGANDAWTVDNLKALIDTVGASETEIADARDIVLEHARANEYDAKYIDMLDEATGSYLGTLDPAKKRLMEVNEAQGEMPPVLDETADSYEDLTEETEEALTAQQQYTDAIKAMTDPIFGAVSSMQDLRQAEAEVLELEKDGKKGTEEWQLAMLDMAEATIGVQDSLDEIDPATLEDAINTIATAMGKTKEETIKFLDELDVLDGKEIHAILKVTAPTLDYIQSGNQLTPHAGRPRQFAMGGRFYRGDEMIVGEQGWEFMTAARSGTVVSNPGTPGGNFADFAGRGFDSDQLVEAIREAFEHNPSAVFSGDINAITNASPNEIVAAIDFKYKTAVRSR